MHYRLFISGILPTTVQIRNFGRVSILAGQHGCRKRPSGVYFVVAAMWCLGGKVFAPCFASNPAVCRLLPTALLGNGDFGLVGWWARGLVGWWAGVDRSLTFPVGANAILSVNPLLQSVDIVPNREPSRVPSRNLLAALRRFGYPVENGM